MRRPRIEQDDLVFDPELGVVMYDAAQHQARYRQSRKDPVDVHVLVHAGMDAIVRPQGPG